MKYKAIYIIAVFCAWLALVQAGAQKSRRGDPAPYFLQLPSHFPRPAYDFSRNPLTKPGVALGRFMFYDYRLSKDSTVSCGFCHQQFAAFGHFDHALAHGVAGQQGMRSVPTLFNMIWQKAFMWDGGVNHLEIQPLTPLTDRNEMAMDLKELLQKMQADPQYRKMFKAAFGSPEITSERMFKAFTQFIATMVSANSKYDSVMLHLPGASFSDEEKAGYSVFREKCAACHKEPLFTDLTYRSNGLPYLAALNDVGRMKITGNTDDNLRFKVPSLRNILKSAPYMHDGRFFDIFQVFDFYDHGIKVTPTTDPLVKSGIPLSDREKRQLYFFLNTLTDYSFLSNKELSEVLIN
ncbi:cytochrome-c peroxidase [Chitinophaga polysaccharea]|uniref:cytochrome-c peroxidase n=1 Tax=Chitinophaga TaxID=79328 RepID=UPI0014559360|nr:MULTISPECIES: cytochrome c peroxidase [Chitinophaga]NLR57121.1 cytochrome-c peroxidase [Chitinophaga polysaccharea]NLU91754.1 cytochrome-c peroxidase [Chitinophaga sp. Ak27]